MKREIKFKAKRLDGKGWVEGNLRTSKSGNAMIIPIENSGAYPVEPTTVCQFTGLKDCDGNELYEHDIIKNYPFIPSEIVWSEELSGYYLKHTNGKIEGKPLGHYLSLGKFMVVGNKFDK